MDTQAVFVFWKCIWGFTIAYYVYDWGLEDGFVTSYAIQGALVTGLGLALALGLIWKGYELREWRPPALRSCLRLADSYPQLQASGRACPSRPSRSLRMWFAVRRGFVCLVS